MKKLILTEDLWLPLDFITRRTTVYGDSGAGKTTLGRLLAEAIHAARQRFMVVDLKNDWHGLRSSADGTRAGIPVLIIGGPNGAMKLFDDGGAVTADLVAGIEQSVVLDPLMRWTHFEFAVRWWTRFRGRRRDWSTRDARNGFRRRSGS